MGRFSVERRLGRGGMATVYLGKDPEGRPVAIKAMLPQLAAEGSFLERFVREVEATRLLRHRNVVQILAAGEQDGLPYLVTEYIEGGSLETMLEECPKLAAPLALEIAAQLFEGLSHAHAQGIVHRDLKPANLLLSTAGVLKVADFGVAKLAGASSLTRTGALFGTPAYMSPEQSQGQHVDARSDLYSAGMILYELLTGQNPHRTEDQRTALLRAQHSAPPIAEVEPTVTPPVEHVVDKLLEREPERRYQNAEQVLTALRPLVEEMRARQPELLAEGLLDPVGVSRKLRAVQAEAFRAKARLLMSETTALPAALWLHRAVLLDPDNQAAQSLFADVCARERLSFKPSQDPRVAELTEQVANASDPARLLIQLAQLHRQEGNPHRAVTCLKRVLRLRPSDAYAASQLTEITGERVQPKVSAARLAQEIQASAQSEKRARPQRSVTPAASTPPAGSLPTPIATPALPLPAPGLTSIARGSQRRRAALLALAGAVVLWAGWRVGHMIARTPRGAGLSHSEAELLTAQGLFDQGDYSACIAACDALLVRSPDSKSAPHATLLRARALLLSQRNDEAVHALGALLQALPEGPIALEAHLLRADAHAAQGKRDAAEADLRAVTERTASKDPLHRRASAALEKLTSH
jgi:tetratricopeptide (TPR) repeat protein